ncbi:MAG: RNA recognition motif domain-containing protein [Chitinophagaceae bacterium]
MTNMYVSNLGFHVREEDLKDLFGSFGEVLAAKVIMDRETGRSRGFGFVEMQSAEEANQAMTSLNNKEIEGRNISVSVARERESRPQRSRW